MQSCTSGFSRCSVQSPGEGLHHSPPRLERAFIEPFQVTGRLRFRLSRPLTRLNFGSSAVDWARVMVLLTLLGILQGCMPVGKEKKGGYLTRLSPPGLRFAPPARVVANLPPLPITPDPQPEVESKSAEAASEPSQATKAAATRRSARAERLPSPDANGTPSNQEIRRPAVAIDSSLMDPQILIRLFSTSPESPPGVEMFVNEATYFQPPVAHSPSTANYEVK